MPANQKPYDVLGKRLRGVREQARRSLAEVSGAVEIDESQLKLIEAGLNRPDEDVMLLLISYFNLVDQEALKLWELAKYDSDLTEHLDLKGSDNVDEQFVSQLVAKPLIALLSIDVRTMYSDGVEVIWSKAGLTLDFSQVSSQGQRLSVAKVGMSYVQAEEVIKCLQRGLLHAKYSSGAKLLPPQTKPKA